MRELASMALSNSQHRWYNRQVNRDTIVRIIWRRKSSSATVSLTVDDWAQVYLFMEEEGRSWKKADFE